MLGLIICLICCCTILCSTAIYVSRNKQPTEPHSDGSFKYFIYIEVNKQLFLLEERSYETPNEAKKRVDGLLVNINNAGRKFIVMPVLHRESKL